MAARLIRLGCVVALLSLAAAGCKPATGGSTTAHPPFALPGGAPSGTRERLSSPGKAKGG